MSKLFQYIGMSFFFALAFFQLKAQDTAADNIVPPEIVQDTIYQKSSVSSSSDGEYQFRRVEGMQKVDARKLPAEELDKVKSDEDYWYVNQPPPRVEKKKEETKPPSSMAWLNTLFWIVLIAGFVALLVWFLATGNIRLFTKVVKQKEEKGEEQPAENIFELNFENEIQKAVAAGNYRMAVRLLYLQTLRDLSLKNLINFTHEKTNADYLFQLAGTSYYKNFFRLTRNFDYTWYGQFPVSQESFSLMQNEFSSFKQQLS